MEWKILPTKSVKIFHVSHEQLRDLRLVVQLFFTQHAASLYGYGSVRVYVVSKTGGNLSAILKNMSHVVFMPWTIQRGALSAHAHPISNISILHHGILVKI